MTRKVALIAALAAVALVVVPGSAAAAVLYNQTDNAGLPTTDGGQPNFAPSNQFPESADRTADDFVVRKGQSWKLSAISVSGAYNGLPPGVVNVFIYANAGGVPGAELISRSGIAASGGPSYRIPMAGTRALRPGRYWLTVQQAGAGDGYWSWTTRTVQSGFPAQWLTEAPEGDCPTGGWNLRTVCWPGTNPDQVFRLEGKATLKCKKKKAAKKQAGASAKKKCKRKRKK